MVNIVNLHRRLSDNVGDLWSSPVHYFARLKEVTVLDIFGYHRTEAGSAEAVQSWIETVQSAHILIVGGGGLLNCEFFNPCFSTLKQYRHPKSSMIFWGLGHNHLCPSSWADIRPALPDFLRDAVLVGVRDAGYEYDWVPCPSVMSPYLDEQRDPGFEVVVYAHRSGSLREKYKEGGLDLPKDTPAMGNNTTMEAAVRFLSSGAVVLTDSYHGALWATLLGRRVVAVPNSSKFFSFYHPVAIGSPEDWQRHAHIAPQYSGALQEAREAEMRFAKRVFEFVADYVAA